MIASQVISALIGHEKHHWIGLAITAVPHRLEHTIDGIECLFSRIRVGKESTSSNVEVDSDTKLCGVCHKMCERIVPLISRKCNLKRLVNEWDYTVCGMNWWKLSYYTHMKAVRDSVGNHCHLCTILAQKRETSLPEDVMTECYLERLCFCVQRRALAFSPGTSADITSAWCLNMTAYQHGPWYHFKERERSRPSVGASLPIVVTEGMSTGVNVFASIFPTLTLYSGRRQERLRFIRHTLFDWFFRSCQVLASELSAKPPRVPSDRIAK